MFKNRKDAQNLFLAEGETEVKLIESLIRAGNVRKFNMWTGKPGQIIKLIGSSHNLYIVYDTDQIYRNERNTFISNIVTFAKNCASITLLQQSENLEDELCRALSCSKKTLYSLFDAQGVRGFKGNLIAESNLHQKLVNRSGFNPEVLWSKDIIQPLAELTGDYAPYKKIKKGSYLSVRHLMK